MISASEDYLFCVFTAFSSLKDWVLQMFNQSAVEISELRPNINH